MTETLFLRRRGSLGIERIIKKKKLTSITLPTVEVSGNGAAIAIPLRQYGHLQTVKEA